MTMTMRAALLLSWLGVAASFKPQTLQTLQRLQRPATGLTAVSQRRPVLAMSAAPEAATATATATAPTLTPERFVVQNRFKVKAGREAAFEKRWADREVSEVWCGLRCTTTTTTTITTPTTTATTTTTSQVAPRHTRWFPFLLHAPEGRRREQAQGKSSSV